MAEVDGGTGGTGPSASPGWRPGRLLGRRLACATVFALAAACGPSRAPGAALVAVGPRALPAFADDLDVASLRAAVERTRPAWARRGEGPAAAAAERLLAALASDDIAARRRAIAEAFRVVEVRGPVLATSYYEPELPARLAPDRRFRWPLYARPHDLVEAEAGVLDPACRCPARLVGRLQAGQVVPYATRGEIYAGALRGRGLELAWSDDLLGTYLLQVQGSGRMRLPDGRLVALRYAGTNGRPYRSLGASMIERGLLTRDEATMAGIRRAFERLPEQEQLALLADNPRFGFFATGDGEGPLGSLGVPLTPGRSVAADPALVPPGSLVWLDLPSVRRFAVVQDTGVAIRGAHVDLFAGAGAQAEAFAGAMRQRGRVLVLVPR